MKFLVLGLLGVGLLSACGGGGSRTSRGKFCSETHNPIPLVSQRKGVTAEVIDKNFALHPGEFIVNNATVYYQNKNRDLRIQVNVTQNRKKEWTASVGCLGGLQHVNKTQLPLKAEVPVTMGVSVSPSGKTTIQSGVVIIDFNKAHFATEKKWIKVDYKATEGVEGALSKVYEDNAQVELSKEGMRFYTTSVTNRNKFQARALLNMQDPAKSLESSEVTARVQTFYNGPTRNDTTIFCNIETGEAEEYVDSLPVGQKIKERTAEEKEAFDEKAKAHCSTVKEKSDKAAAEKAAQEEEQASKETETDSEKEAASES